MRVLKCAILLLVIILSVPAYSQKITRIVRSHVLIDADQTSGLKVGDKVPVLRKTPAGKEKRIGSIEIVMFKEGKCVGKIISKDPQYKIGLGDYIDLKKYTKVDYSGKRKHLLSYLAVGTGIIACGLGYYFYDQADQTYEDYLAASTANERIRLYNKTYSYDNKSNFSFGIGGGLIAFGVINYLINRNKDSAYYYEKAISIYPFQKNDCIGMGIQLCLNHPHK